MKSRNYIWATTTLTRTVRQSVSRFQECRVESIGRIVVTLINAWLISMEMSVDKRFLLKVALPDELTKNINERIIYKCQTVFS